jgi:hypothetical protein
MAMGMLPVTARIVDVVVGRDVVLAMRPSLDKMIRRIPLFEFVSRAAVRQRPVL